MGVIIGNLLPHSRPHFSSKLVQSVTPNFFSNASPFSPMTQIIELIFALPE